MFELHTQMLIFGQEKHSEVSTMLKIYMNSEGPILGGVLWGGGEIWDGQFGYRFEHLSLPSPTDSLALVLTT